MRAPTASEIVLLARVLSRMSNGDRLASVASILAEADSADLHRRRTGHAHPAHGDGSLMARCSLLCPPPEPLADDREFLVCLALAANAVLLHSGQ